MEDVGYTPYPFILNTSKYTSIPQNRERTFIICFRDDLEFFKDLLLSYRVQGVEIPERLKKLKANVENQIEKIGCEND